MKYYVDAKKFYNYDFGEEFWFKYTKADRIHDGMTRHRFECRTKPVICRRENKRLKIIACPDKYLVKYGSMVVDLKGNLLGIHIREQIHPHKDPNSGYICLGQYENMKFDRKCMDHVFNILMSYNPDDCFCIPTEEICIWEDNQCQTS